MQRFETNITLHCRNCGKNSLIDVDVPELDFSGDKMSDHVSEGEVEFNCPEWDAYYYGCAFCSGSWCSLTIEYDDAKFGLDSDPPMYSPPDDDWLDFDIPDYPYAIFCSTHDQMLKLLEASIDTPEDPQIFAGMIFAQIISAMEA